MKSFFVSCCRLIQLTLLSFPSLLNWLIPFQFILGLWYSQRNRPYHKDILIKKEKLELRKAKCHCQVGAMPCHHSSRMHRNVTYSSDPLWTWPGRRCRPARTAGRWSSRWSEPRARRADSRWQSPSTAISPPIMPPPAPPIQIRPLQIRKMDRRPFRWHEKRELQTYVHKF